MTNKKRWMINRSARAMRRIAGAVGFLNSVILLVGALYAGFMVASGRFQKVWSAWERSIPVEYHEFRVDIDQDTDDWGELQRGTFLETGSTQPAIVVESVEHLAPNIDKIWYEPREYKGAKGIMIQLVFRQTPSQATLAHQEFTFTVAQKGMDRTTRAFGVFSKVSEEHAPRRLADRK